MASETIQADPREIDALHEIRDRAKLAWLAESMERDGWVGRPLVAYDDGNGLHALTGTHRIRAAIEAGIQVPVYVVDVIHAHEDGSEDCPICALVDARDDDERAAAAARMDDSYLAELLSVEAE